MSADGRYITYLGYILSRDEVKTVTKVFERMANGETFPELDSLVNKEPFQGRRWEHFGGDVWPLLHIEDDKFATCCHYPGSVLFGQCVCVTHAENGDTDSLSPDQLKTKEEIDQSLGNLLPFYEKLFGKEPQFGFHCQPSDCCSCT